MTAPPASHPGNNPSLVVPRREHAGIRSPRPAFPSTVTTARAHDTGPPASWPTQPPGWSAVRASVWEGLLQTFMPAG